MTTVLYVILTALISYLLGSISFAVIVSRALAHKDVRDYGSGNAGLTNVVRNFGKLPGLLTLVGDFSKGVVAVMLGRVIFDRLAGLEPQYGACVAGLFVIIGHIFPVFFGFRGGKGVLTTAGIALVIDPRVFLIAVSIFIIVFLITRIVSILIDYRGVFLSNRNLCCECSVGSPRCSGYRTYCLHWCHLDLHAPCEHKTIDKRHRAEV